MLFFLVLIVMAGPSLIGYSPIAHSMLSQKLAEYGWKADAQSIQIGWVTPARVTGLRMTGDRAGSIIEIGELQSTLTLPQLLSGDVAGGQFGDIVLRDVQIKCDVRENTSSIERDLTDFLTPTDEPSSVRPDGNVQIQELHVSVSDAVTSAVWTFKQANASVKLTPDELQSQWQGVLSQPGGNDGSMQGEVTCSMQGDGLPLSVKIESDSLPMSVVSLVARRFPESRLPAEVTGDLSGVATVNIPASGHPSISLRKIELRDLAAYDPQTRTRLWNNQLTQIDGDAVWQPGRIVARQIKATTDFATMSIDGSFADSISISGSQSNPLAWLDQVDATAAVEVDLPRMQAALPGLLPLRQDATLQRGLVRASIQPIQSSDRGIQRQRRRRLVIHSDAVEAVAGGRPVRIAAMDATAIVASDASHLRAEQFELTSPFANVRGQGDLASGAANVEVDFGKLAAMLRPIIEMKSQDLQGLIKANLRWDSESNGLWRLRGDTDINNLAIRITPNQQWKQKQLKSVVDVEGRWSGIGDSWSLDELSRGTLSVSGDGFQTDAELVQTIRGLDRNQFVPIRLRGQGRIESIIEMARPWVPDVIANSRGGLNFSARGSVNAAGEALLQTVDGQLTSISLPMSDRDWQQDLIKLHFDGKALWPRQEVEIQTMTLTGDAMSAAVQGEWVNTMSDLEIAWRADLNRLQTSAAKRVARDTGVNRPAAYSSNRPDPVADTSWKLRGQLEGNTVIVGDTANLHVDTKISGRDIEMLETGKITKSIWFEPAVEVDGKFQLNMINQTATAESLQVSSDWCGVSLIGSASYVNDVADVQLRGPARFKMDQVSRRLTTLTGTAIVAEGLHETPLEIMYAQNNREQYAFTIKGNLGWETIDTAGMLFGPAEVPFKMTETTVTISPSRIPILGASRLTPRFIGPQLPPLAPQPGVPGNPNNSGEILIAGDVHYRPELWIEVVPGPIARNVTLTPDMTQKWLKYLAPIASDAARVQGNFGAELEQAIVYIDDPRRSQIRGRLNIEQVRMNAGPLADQVISGARQLQALAAIGSNVRPASTGSTLITLPAQTVDFQVYQGVVDHRALIMDVDRARVITSGQVDFDGRLNLTAQIPLDAKWLGNDLQSLSGQSITLPIDGTLSRPSLDSTGIRRVVANFGVQAATTAAQDAAGNFLQQQIGRGQQQLEQGLNKSLEKLRIDKLFGN